MQEEPSNCILCDDGHYVRAALVLQRLLRGLEREWAVKKAYTPLWGYVRALTGHGSTYSVAICRWAGVDPDAGLDNSGRQLTPQQAFVLTYLAGFDRSEFVSPTAIGCAARNVGLLRSEFTAGSAWASPICKRMVRRGLVERSAGGRYRITHEGFEMAFRYALKSALG